MTGIESVYEISQKRVANSSSEANCLRRLEMSSFAVFSKSFVLLNSSQKLYLITDSIAYGVVNKVVFFHGLKQSYEQL